LGSATSYSATRQQLIFFFSQLQPNSATARRETTRRKEMGMITEREIAVRGFMNERYNTSFGKGLFRRAVYNGSLELANPSQKYLIDLYEFGLWQHQAKTDYQINIFHKIDAMGGDEEKNLLLSWVLHYDPLTKTKTSVDGYCIYMPSTDELYIEIADPLNGTDSSWSLNVKPCKNTGKGKPVFIATNVDLSSWGNT
jgi:hypothetical protein